MNFRIKSKQADIVMNAVRTYNLKPQALIDLILHEGIQNIDFILNSLTKGLSENAKKPK